MKTLTFFNEKGGVGKSSFAIMYASWLQYVHGLKVAVVDFNDRLIYYREDEINFRQNLDEAIKKEYQEKLDRFNSQPSNSIGRFSKPQKPLLSWDRVKDVKAWPIIKEDKQAIAQIKKSNNRPYSTWIKNLNANEKFKDIDVLIYDFAGSIDDTKFVDILSSDLISLTVIPVDRDQQTVNSSVRTTCLINRYKSRKYCVFLNQVNLSIKNFKNKNVKLVKELTDKAYFRFLPDMISFSDRMKKISEIDIMRSNFEYPTWGKGAFKDSEDIGIDNLFIDITKLLATTDDIYNTNNTDLSFANELRKKEDPNRQFTGSFFPQFEM